MAALLAAAEQEAAEAAAVPLPFTLHCTQMYCAGVPMYSGKSWISQGWVASGRVLSDGNSSVSVGQGACRA